MFTISKKKVYFYKNGVDKEELYVYTVDLDGSLKIKTPYILWTAGVRK